jgi:hypothetical protein
VGKDGGRAFFFNAPSSTPAGVVKIELGEHVAADANGEDEMLDSKKSSR